jgi:ribosome-binding protein aMBF1 (putative translation factor)
MDCYQDKRIFFNQVAIKNNEEINMVKSKMFMKRMQDGTTGLELAKKLQAAGLPQMTENRVCRIETGRALPTEAERQTIARLLGVKPWEINI